MTDEQYVSQGDIMGAALLAFPGDAAVDVESARMRERFLAWAGEAAPAGGAIRLDLLVTAVRAHNRAERIHKAEEAEARLRVRHSDALWRRREAVKLVETVARLDANPLVAAYELESTVLGCEWAVENLKGMLESMRVGRWETAHHKLLRKLLKYDCGDVDGSVRVPDLWFFRIHRMNQIRERSNTPIAELEWEIRVITCEKLEIAKRHDVELREQLEAETLPLLDKVEALVEEAIARFEAARLELEPLEALDREQAKIRALVDDSPLSKQRARLLKDAEATLHACLARVDAMNKRDAQAEKRQK